MAKPSRVDQRPCNRMQNTPIISGSSKPMAKEVTKNEIKHTIKTQIREKCIKRMQEGSKTKDRVNLNSDETQYPQRLFLSNCSLCWISNYSGCIQVDHVDYQMKKK